MICHSVWSKGNKKWNKKSRSVFRNMTLKMVVMKRRVWFQISIKSVHSPGLDDVPGFVANRCIDLLVQLLTWLFNISLEETKFPELLKYARIVPIYNNNGDVFSQKIGEIVLCASDKLHTRRKHINKISAWF